MEKLDCINDRRLGISLARLNIGEKVFEILRNLSEQYGVIKNLCRSESDNFHLSLVPQIEGSYGNFGGIDYLIVFDNNDNYTLYEIRKTYDGCSFDKSPKLYNCVKCSVSDGVITPLNEEPKWINGIGELVPDPYHQ